MPEGPRIRGSLSSSNHHRGPCSRTLEGEHPAQTARPALVRRPSAAAGAWAAHAGGPPQA
eukprot:3173568-Alexandrium_andersonii.AAC.1